MATYFKEFPTVNYQLENSNIQLTNIFESFKVKETVFEKISVFFEYHVQDGETPEIVAHKLYGDITLEWVILMFNKIHDPYFGWVMDSLTFDKYIKTKYGSIEAATQLTHEYQWIVFDRKVDDFGVTIPEKIVVVDQATYLSLDANRRREIKSYDYEISQNEKRRIIQIPDERYISQLVAEKERVFNK